MVNHRLSRKVLISVMGTITFLLVAMSALNYIWAQRVAVQVSEDRATALVSAASAQIQSFLQTRGQYAWILAQNEQIRQFVQGIAPGEGSSPAFAVAPKEITRSLERIAERDPSIVFVYIAIAKTNRLYANKEFEYPSKYDVKSRVWFVEVQTKKRMVITDPYDCPLTRHRVVTAAVPMFDSEGQVCAVVCVDILLDELKSIVSSLNVFKTGLAFLVDKDNVPILHALRNGASNDQQALEKALERLQGPALYETINKEGGTGQTMITLNGKKQYLFYTPIKELDWTIGFIVPVSEVTYPIVSLGIISAFTALLGLLLVFFLLKMMIVRIILPLEGFSDILHRVAQGDYSLRVSSRANNELGELAGSINAMLEKQQELIDLAVKTAYKMGVAGQNLMITLGEARVTLPLLTASIGHLLDQDKNVEQKSSSTIHNTMLFLDQSIALQERMRVLMDIGQKIEQRIHVVSPDSHVDYERLFADTEKLQKELDLFAKQDTAIRHHCTELFEAYAGLQQKQDNTTDLLRIISEHVRIVSDLQIQSVTQAEELSQNLVDWSHILLKMAARSSLFEEEEKQAKGEDAAE